FPASKPPIEPPSQVKRAGTPAGTLTKSRSAIVCPNNENPETSIPPREYKPIHVVNRAIHSRRSSLNVLPSSPSTNSTVISAPARTNGGSSTTTARHHESPVYLHRCATSTMDPATHAAPKTAENDATK